MAKLEQGDSSPEHRESDDDEGESRSSSEESYLDQMVRRLWDLRERDAAAVAELAARVEKFEAAFEACWSVIRRLEVMQGDLTARIDHQGVMLDQSRDADREDDQDLDSRTWERGGPVRRRWMGFDDFLTDDRSATDR